MPFQYLTTTYAMTQGRVSAGRTKKISAGRRIAPRRPLTCCARQRSEPPAPTPPTEGTNSDVQECRESRRRARRDRENRRADLAPSLQKADQASPNPDHA